MRAPREQCPIRKMLTVIRENMRPLRSRRFFQDHLRVRIGAVLGLAAGHRRRQGDRHGLRFHNYLRVPNRAVLLSRTF